MVEKKFRLLNSSGWLRLAADPPSLEATARQVGSNPPCSDLRRGNRMIVEGVGDTSPLILLSSLKRIEFTTMFRNLVLGQLVYDDVQEFSSGRESLQVDAAAPALPGKRQRPLEKNFRAEIGRDRSR